MTMPPGMREIAKLSDTEKQDLLCCIWYSLYPGDNPDHEWSADTLDEIAEAFRSFDLVCGSKGC